MQSQQHFYFFDQELSTSHIQSLYKGTYNDNIIKEKKQNESTSEETKRTPIEDIQINPSNDVQDEQVKPNYIPPSNIHDDYLQKYQEFANDHFPTYQKLKHRDSLFDSIFSEIQLPVFVSTLYFIFNLPIFNSFIMKYFSFLDLYYDDGNINLLGIIIKSSVFGFIFFSLNKTIDYLTII